MGWKYLVMEECEGAGLEDADHTNVCTEKQKHQKQVLKRSKDFFFLYLLHFTFPCNLPPAFLSATASCTTLRMGPDFSSHLLSDYI